MCSRDFSFSKQQKIKVKYRLNLDNLIKEYLNKWQSCKKSISKAATLRESYFIIYGKIDEKITWQ
jgi:hypothetical protein